MADLNIPEALKTYLREVNLVPPLTKQEQTEIILGPPGEGLPGLFHCA